MKPIQKNYKNVLQWYVLYITLYHYCYCSFKSLVIFPQLLRSYIQLLHRKDWIHQLSFNRLVNLETPTLTSIWTETYPLNTWGTRVAKLQLPVRLDLFKLYLNFSVVTGDTLRSINPYHQNLFIANIGIGLPLHLNIPKFYQKWIHSYQLLYNLFFHKLPIITFASKLLKYEVSSFNWIFTKPSLNLFKYTNPYFNYKNNPYGETVSIFYDKLAMSGYNTAFITDVRVYKRSLYFLTKADIYTIGLIPYDLNPWIVRYSIPISTSTIITQYMFLKILLYLYREATLTTYGNLKLFWLKSM